MKRDLPLSLIQVHALQWCGTPFETGAALRGVAADCIGLVRGVYSELTGTPIPAPVLSADWSRAREPAMIAGLEKYARRIDVRDARPGHVVTLRVGSYTAAHIGIMVGGGLIQAVEGGGVRVTPIPKIRRISSAWALPSLPAAPDGISTLSADDFLATIYPHGKQYRAEITHGLTGEFITWTSAYENQAAAARHLSAIYPHIESME